MGLVDSAWEDDEEARGEGRPRRRYYTLTPEGKAHLSEARARARVVARLFEKRGRA